MVNIRKHIVPPHIAAKVTYGGVNSCKYIVIHETGNTGKGANANAHAKLQARGNSRSASWHYTVDDKEIVQSFDDKDQCWHAGNAYYNKNAIGIEICVNSDGNYLKAVENAVKLTKYLMKKYNIPINNIIQHNHASGKNCPQNLRSGKKGITWNDFITMVKGSEVKVSESKNNNTSTKTSNTTKTLNTKWTKVSGNWTGQILKKGHYGEPVKQLQTMLKNKGYLKESDIDSYFGNITENAVKRAQKDAGIKVDGIAGQQTYKVLNKINKNKKSKSQSVQNGDIKYIQLKLNNNYNTGLKIDGVFGKLTKAALVKALQIELNKQYKAGLKVDGVFGSKTKAKCVTLRRGAKGNITWILQAILYCLRYDPKGLDGIFGSNTEKAVKQFQKNKKITVDGIVGKVTWGKLFS